MCALVVMVIMFTFRVLCTAVFAEPAITQIKEMGCLVHRIEIPGDQRRASGDSVKRTGTDVRLPSRQMAT